MRNWIFCTFFLFTFFDFYHLKGQFFPAKVYDSQDGLPTNAIFDIIQDDNDVIWMVTSKGIITYDAHNWTTISDSVELPYDIHTLLYKSTNGDVWVVGNIDDNFRMHRYNGERWITYPFPVDWSSNWKAISFLIYWNQQNQLQVLLGGGKNVHQFDVSSETWNSLHENYPAEAVVISLNQIDEEIYVNTSAGQYKLIDQKWKYSDLNQKDRSVIITMEKYQDFTYVLGQDWLGRYSNAQFELLSNDIGVNGSFNSKRNSLIIDDEKIYYSNNCPPLYFNINTRRYKQLSVEGRERAALSNKLLQTNDGILWSADSRGLFKFNLNQFENWNLGSGLLEDEVTAITSAPNGQVVLANARGINFIKDGNIIDQHKIINDPLSNQSKILDLAFYDDRIFVAGSSEGLIEFKDGLNEKLIRGANKVRANAVEVFENELYIISGKEVLIYNQGNLKTVLKLEGNIYLRNLVNINDEQLALLTNQGGLYLSDGSTFIQYKANLTSLNNLYAATLWNDQLILATEHGLATLEDDRIIALEIPGLDEVTFALLSDTSGNLWIGTYNGIYRWDGDQIISFNKYRGLVGNEVNRNALHQDQEGTIWIGTDLGASAYFGDINTTNASGPQVELLRKPAQQLSYQENTVSIDFRAISFVNNDVIDYQYQLSPIDSDWRSANNKGNTEVIYNNLPAGKYTFQVKAKNEISDWGSINSYDFKVDTPLTEKAWFLLILALLFSGFIFMLFRLRLLYLLRQKRKLEILITERTQELSIANERLIETQDKLIKTEKDAALGTLTAGVAHELNNPSNFVHSGLKVLESIIDESQDHIVIKDIETYKNVKQSITEGTRRIVSIVKSLNNMTRFSNAAKKQINLNDVIKYCLDRVQEELNDPKKNIAIELSADSVAIYANQDQIRQMCYEVIKNAYQAIKTAGSISIKLTNKDDAAVIEISDSGSGMKMNETKKIYDPFYTTKEPNEGSGLGLSIVLNILHEYNGNIVCDSQPGSGTKFTMTIPVAEETTYGKKSNSHPVR